MAQASPATVGDRRPEQSARSSEPPKIQRFAEAAEKASARLGRLSWLATLRRTISWLLVGALLPLLIARLAGFSWANWFTAALAVGAWVGLCWLWSRWRRPQGFKALATWDRAAGGSGQYPSALEFESRDEADRSLGEAIHLQRAGATLPDALTRMHQDLPARIEPWVWVVPILAVALFLLPWLRPIGLVIDPALTDEMVEEAKKESDEIARQVAEMSPADALEPEEMEKMEQLREAVSATAGEVGDASGKTTREVLDALEERAREAEKLARELGAGDEPWASEAMIQELRSQPDTADFGEAVEDKDTSSVATEADNLADKIDADDRTKEIEERLESALESASEKGEEEDAKRLVGRPVSEAATEMDRGETEAAAEKFRNLAKSMKRLEERENAIEKLEKLAQQLRQAGSNITGTGGSGMEKMDGNDGGENGQNQNGQMNDLGNQAHQHMPLPIPGMPPAGAMPNFPNNNMNGQNLPQFQMGQNGEGIPLIAPIPGMMPPGDGMPNPNGGMPGDGDMPMMMAPIPGLPPGEQPDAMMLGGDGPPDAIMIVPGMGGPGGMPGMPGSGMQGGLQAGHGTAELAGAATEGSAAERQGMVNAVRNADGESYTRMIEGGAREETAGRSTREAAAEFLRVQEEALDDKDLPFSRREHVRRYFEQIRQQFEGE